MCVIEALVHSPLSPKRHNLVESRYECVIRREIEREKDPNRLVVVGIGWNTQPRAVRFWEENNAVIRREAEREKVNSRVLRRHLVYWNVNSRFLHLPTFFFTRESERGEENRERERSRSLFLLIINRANEAFAWKGRINFSTNISRVMKKSELSFVSSFLESRARNNEKV